MKETVGVTFPVPKRYMSRFFEEGKTIFIKPATLFKQLENGMRFVFYQSHEETGYVGEARIKRIVFDKDPFRFYEIYGDSIFLSKQELQSYITDQEKWKSIRAHKAERKKRGWMALELYAIQKYDHIQKPEHFIPASGKYLRQ